MKSLLLPPALLIALLNLPSTSASCSRFTSSASSWTLTSEPPAANEAELQKWDYPIQVSDYIECDTEVMNETNLPNVTHFKHQCRWNQCPMDIKASLKQPMWFNQTTELDEGSRDDILERFYKEVIKSAVPRDAPDQYYACGSIHTRLELDEEPTWDCLDPGQNRWHRWDLNYWCVEGVAEECSGDDAPFASGTPLTVCGPKGLFDGQMVIEDEREIRVEETGLVYRANDSAPHVGLVGEVCEASGAERRLNGASWVSLVGAAVVGAGIVLGL